MPKHSLYNIGLLALLSTLLLGCAPNAKLQPSPPELFHAAGGSGGLGKILGLTKQTKSAILSDLNQHGIQYVEYGDLNTLIIPTDKFYQFNRAEFNDICYPGLINVVQLLRYYPKSEIYVAGFTDNIGSKEHKKRLTEARAEKMVGFLWANHISAKYLHAQGYADKYSIGDNHLIHGSAYNRRIEIQWSRNKNPCCEQQIQPAAVWK